MTPEFFPGRVMTISIGARPTEVTVVDVLGPLVTFRQNGTDWLLEVNMDEPLDEEEE